jgi:phage head maturation protease
MPKKFILNDESVLNSHGFYLLNAGGIFDRFNDNPVMLDAHDSDSCLDVIGRWGALSVEGKQLLSTPEFDMADPEAAKISGKVDRGYVKGASMGIYILEAELRDIPGLGLYPVVTKWELLEASPVPVPSNKSSLRLYAADRKTVLKAEQISLSIDTIIKPKQKMEKITLSAEAAKALALGKEPEATDLNAAIMELSARETASVAAKNKAEKELSDHRTHEATALVDLAVKEGRITAEKKDSFIKMATADLQQAKDVIAALPAKETFSDKTKTGNKGVAGREDWDYMRWLKEDNKGLLQMEANEPERFQKLKADFKRV